MKKRFHFHAIGLVLILGIVGLINLVVYEASKLSLLVPNDHISAAGAIISAAIGLSFFIVAFLAQKQNTPLTRWWYRITALWLGFLIYLFSSSFIYILYVAVEGTARPFALGLFVATVGITIVGALHARHTKIKSLTVTIPNLPSAWKGRRAAFISDVHLGQVYGKGFADVVSRRIQALGVDIVFIVGDLYDGVKVDEKDIVSPFSKITAPLGIYFVMGNHEEFASNEGFMQGVLSVGMHVLTDEMAVVDGMQIVGVDFQTTSTAEKFNSVIDSIPFDHTMPSILLKHVPTDIPAVEKRGISLQLSGHTHKGQTFPVTLLTRIMFKKFNYGYQTYKKLQVITSSGVGTTGSPIRVETNSEIVLITFN